MSPVAFALIGASVLCHATWNLMAKRAAAAGMVFVAAWTVLAALIWAPLGVWTVVTHWSQLRPGMLWYIGVAICLHSGSQWVLQRGYATGDLSVVYPISRGLAPVLTCLVAVPVFGEDPGLAGWAGTFALAISVAVLGKPDSGALARFTPVAYAIAVGVFISAYTLWDKQSVAVAAIPPLLVNWCSDTGRSVTLLPLLWRRREQVRQLWASHRREVLVTAVCSPLAYILVLVALTMAPVTLVAPLRETSVLLVVFLGARFLGEKDMWRRLIAALGVVLGAVGVTLGRS